MIASLGAVVRRGEEGRRLSQELDRLEAEESIVRDRLAAQTARADSLGALPRIERAARAIGLRRAGDGEVFHLSERVQAIDGEGSDGDGARDGKR